MLYRAAGFALGAAPLIVLMQRSINALAHKGWRAMRVSAAVSRSRGMHRDRTLEDLFPGFTQPVP